MTATLGLDGKREFLVSYQTHNLWRSIKQGIHQLFCDYCFIRQPVLKIQATIIMQTMVKELIAKRLTKIGTSAFPKNDHLKPETK